MPKPKCAGAVPTHRDVNKQADQDFFSHGRFPFFTSEIGRYGVIRVIGKREVARKIDLDAVPLADGHRRKNVEKAIEDLRGRLRGTLRESLAHEIPSGCREGARGSTFGNGPDRSNRERGTEDAEVMVVDLVAEASVADLVESLKMVEAGGIAVGHDQAMKGNREPRLPEAFDLAGFSQQGPSSRNEQMLAIVGIDSVGQEALDWSGKLTIETVDEQGFEDGAFKQNVVLSCPPGRCAPPPGHTLPRF